MDVPKSEIQKIEAEILAITDSNFFASQPSHSKAGLAGAVLTF